MFSSERRADVLCVTISDQQAAYIRSRGLSVVQHDLEVPLPFSEAASWDVAIMMESLEHIRGKRALLSDIRRVAKRLLLQVNCTALELSPEKPVFNDSMLMPKVDELVAILLEAGWKIRFSCNRRYQSFPSFMYWKLGLLREFPAQDFPTSQLRALNALCDDALSRPAIWMAENPMMDIVAE